MTPAADDLDRLMAVMHAAFDPAYGEAWTRRQVEDALLIGNCHYLLFDSQGIPAAPGVHAAGFTLSRTGFQDEELLLFAVAPRSRRRGIGWNMLSELVRQTKERGARQLFLEMRKGNPAESLYRRFGFQPIGQRPNYYRLVDGRCIDAITFALTIY